MARETNLDHLSTLLGQCLGRIDERAYQLQQLGDDENELDAHEVLAQEAATLQELVGSLLERHDSPEMCDVNRIVEQSVSACLRELDTAILVRERLAPNLPPSHCTPSQLAYATQRALVIAAGRLEPGGELLVSTRQDGEAVMIEFESRGGVRDRHLQERSLTLCEFVASFHGNCHIDLDDRANLLIVIELPQVPVLDER